MGEPLAAGTRIDGRYVLEARLGAGTFGEVWRASDAKFSGRAVAVKLLKAEFLHHLEAVARFDGEATALAALTHTNVVGVFDRGEWGGGRYLVTELVDGESLEAWLAAHEKAHTLPALEAVRDIFDQICAGVEAAHDVRAPEAIVHRDLKPANVMLAKGKKGARIAKVLDFGIARLGARQRTKSGFAMGTPLYMSPEQGLGKASDVGPMSDVFSLGVILVEMLSLRQTVGEDDLWWAKVLDARFDAEGLVRGLRSDAPAGVWAVAVKALRRERSERFADAGEMRDALKGAWSAAQATPPPVPLPPTPALVSVPTPPIPRGAASNSGTLTSTEPMPGPTLPMPPGPIAIPLPSRKPRPPYVALGVAASILAIGAVALGVGFGRDGGDKPLPTASAKAADPPPSSAVIPPVAPKPPPTAPAPAACPDGMVSIPGGTFQMGSKAYEGESAERPQHPETVAAFCIDKTEVTVGAYRVCVGKTTCSAPDTGTLCNWGVAGRDEHPVNCVDWNQAKSYCELLGKLLPTENEWEFAARGSEGRTYPWGTPPPTNQLCWNGEGSDLGKGTRLGTCKVGSYKSGDTPLGVQDMAGNVWEWTADLYCPYLGNNCTEKARVHRGGGWYDRLAPSMRGANRNWNAPSDRSIFVGFRCARAN